MGSWVPFPREWRRLPIRSKTWWPTFLRTFSDLTSGRVSRSDDATAMWSASASLACDCSFSGAYRFFAFSNILPFNSSGLGRTSVVCRSSMGALTRASPKTFFMILANMSCWSNPQWTSAQTVTGYGDVTKPHFAIASQTSRTGTLEVNVRP